MILVENLSKSFADRLLFSEVSFRINDGEKVGIVGKNGTGKSTLIKIIIGNEEFDEGIVTGFHAEDLGYAEQIPTFSSLTLLDELLSIGDVKEFEAKKILFGLGFNEAELAKNPNEFSGGETDKIALAKALVAEFYFLTSRLIILTSMLLISWRTLLNPTRELFSPLHMIATFCKIALTKSLILRIVMLLFMLAIMINSFD